MRKEEKKKRIKEGRKEERKEGRKEGRKERRDEGAAAGVTQSTHQRDQCGIMSRHDKYFQL